MTTGVPLQWKASFIVSPHASSPAQLQARECLVSHPGHLETFSPNGRLVTRQSSICEVTWGWHYKDREPGYPPNGRLVTRLEGEPGNHSLLYGGGITKHFPNPNTNSWQPVLGNTAHLNSPLFPGEGATKILF